MAIKYSIDELHINEFSNSIKIMMKGWCASLDGKIPTLSIKINDKEVNYSITGFSREDAVKVFNLPETARKCGFSVIINDYHEKIKTFKVVATCDDEKKLIVSLNQSILQKMIDKSSIVGNIDSAIYDEMNHMLKINGWAYSDNENELQFFIKSETEGIEKCISRSVSRDDLVESGYVAEENKMCGFMISFPCSYSRKMKLLISDKTGEDCCELAIKLNNANKLTVIKSLIKNFNIETIKKTIRYVQNNGFQKTFLRLKLGYVPDNFNYNSWFINRRVSDREIEQQKKIKFTYSPLLTVVIFVTKYNQKTLVQFIESLNMQSYTKWKLLIITNLVDLITQNELIQIGIKENKIHIYSYNSKGDMDKLNKMLYYTEENEYISICRPNSILEKNAFFEIVKQLDEIKHDIIYTDEDYISSVNDELQDPCLKPDYSIDLLRSYNYIGNLCFVDKDTLIEAGGLGIESGEMVYYDFILRCVEKAKSIYHLPLILLHSRKENIMLSDSNKFSDMPKIQKEKRALENHFVRCNESGIVNPVYFDDYTYAFHITYDTKDNPLVSIVIPNYESKSVLKRCMDSLLNINTYQNIEIIIVENNSKSSEIFDYYREIQNEHNNIKVVTWTGTEFNFSAINNYGVSFAKGDYILFLNNDTEVISPDAISEMLGCCMREEVGAVGAKLLFENDTVQHAGVVVGFGGAAGHVFSGIGKNETGFMMRPLVNCNYSAVTAACMMTKKDLFEVVGGFDENLKVAFNDIDLCLKIRKLSKLVVYNAFSLWHHYESLSRGYETTPEKSKRFEKEIAIFQEKWHDILIDGDPYYNKNFDVAYTPFKLH